MLSVIVPVYNEEEGIKAFFKELKKFLPQDYEVIFVDDGSTDKTLSFIKEIGSKNKNIRYFSLRRHQGKAEALTIGFQKSKGDFVLTIDADLQDRPDQIGKLQKKINEEWDMVSGWRNERKDSPYKKLTSKLFNLMASAFWGLKLNDLNCGLKLYRKGAAKSLNLYGGLHRFIPILLHQEGFRVTEVPVVHDVRKFGKSKYTFMKVFTDIPDMFTMLFLSKYSNRPLHFFWLIGLIFGLLGFLILFYLSIIWLQGESIGRRPLLIFGVLFTLAGIQVFFTGFLADLFISGTKSNKSEEVMVKEQSD